MDVSIVVLFGTVVVALVLPWVQDALNKLWNLHRQKAFSLALLLSLSVSVLSLFLSGGLTLQSFTPENFLATFGLVFSIHQAVYQFVLKFLDWGTDDIRAVG